MNCENYDPTAGERRNTITNYSQLCITRTSVVHRNPTAVVEQAIYSITCIARETCVWDIVDYFTHLRSTSTAFDFGGTIFFVSGFVTKR